MKRFREIFKSEAGFTLIELLVVIAVLGILAGIAVPRITGVQDNARKRALETNATTIRNAFEMYYASEGEYPDLTTSDTISDINDAFDGSGVEIDIPSDFSLEVITATDNSTDPKTYSVRLTSNGYYVDIKEDGLGTITATS